MGSTYRRSGFTLIELLLVCALLATLSYVAWGAYLGVDRRAEDELARGELLRLADALRRFHDDTGYWPGEGPFQLNEGCKAAGIAAVDPGHAGPYSEPSSTGSATAEQQEAWFKSPANLSLLFKAPVLCAGHRLVFLQKWNADTHRGWNGPYLPVGKRHWVDLLASGNLVNIPAFGAGPAFAPNGANAGCTAADLNRCAFNWKMRPSSSASAGFARHARPFLFLLYDESAGTTEPAEPPESALPRAVPRVVYAGADGRYGGANPLDPCLASDSADGRDDVVICF
ncbi:MAG: prepilin-type N-terminal cleavage/methylation domain-containing protein [Azoarcus sp.]|jgi:prepilin-type N-terminal cleavage/methylation domain-containing protein|nr:prepilin-type N-terminal cleavage/methylation domain-containing protein [Azoarcus sp.]